MNLLHADKLTQIESRLEAALDDLETVHNVFIAHNKDDFGMQLSAFEAQEKIETVFHYIKEITHKEDTQCHWNSTPFCKPRQNGV